MNRTGSSAVNNRTMANNKGDVKISIQFLEITVTLNIDYCITRLLTALEIEFNNMLT